MKLSVLVVTYNHEKYITQCLDSILSQQVSFDYELVLGVDLCSDNTLDICKYYSSKYPQIKLLQTKERLGMVNNWKRSLYSCQGDYIAICEGDDYWTDNLKLQKQVDFLDKYLDCGLCYTDCNIVCENTQETFNNIINNGYSYLDESNPLNNKNYACNVTWMLRKQFIQYFNIKEDNLDIPLTILYEIYLRAKVKYVSINSGVYRRHDDSVSFDIKNKRKMYEHQKYTFNFFDEYIPKFEKDENEYLSKHYSKGLWTIYPNALYYKDQEIINKFEKFFKGRLNLEDFLQRVKNMENNLNQAYQTINEVKNTFSYKLGFALTSPLRWIKKIFGK
ncbi:MAG: glycosyltransferase [Bacteroidales bacterium]|nr:glycosyltransferase [Bacteroidales bacterium]